MSHYAMVIVDGSSNKKEIFYLKDNTTVIQHTNGFVTISINSTLVSNGNFVQFGTFNIIES